MSVTLDGIFATISRQDRDSQRLFRVALAGRHARLPHRAGTLWRNSMSTIDRAMMQANAGERLAIVLSSYRRLTGRILAPDADGLWNSPLAILAHDRARPPAFFYANNTALALFRMRARDMIGMPSTHSAEPDHREERAAMLQRLDRDDLVSGYQGIRIAADGTRFRISDAMIWNLIDENGQHHGQAAAIAHWEHL